MLCCVCGVLGHLAPVQPCARSVHCNVCAVSWATGCSSTVCTLGVLCCVSGILGHLAPVHRCAPSVCCTECCVCGILRHLAPVHWRARWVRCVACAGPPCGARTCPSGQLHFVAGRGWVPSGRAHVHLDGRCSVTTRGCARCWARVHPDGNWCCWAPVLVPSFIPCCARFQDLRHPVAVVDWHLSVRLGCGRRLASLAYFVAPRGPAALIAPIGFPDAVAPFCNPGRSLPRIH